MRILSIATVFFALFVLASCFDPEPAEIGANCKLNGKSKGCLMVLLNSKGVQINQEPTDYYGIGYFKGLKPGTYIVKFMDHQENFYAAEYKVKLRAGDSQSLDVELSKAPDTPVMPEG